MSLILLTLGCSWFDPDLAVEAVQPAELRVGTELQVVGQGFAPDIEVRLEAEGVSHPLDELEVRGGLLIEGRVPSLEPGPYDLVVTRGTHTVRAPLLVRAEADEQPCARGYEANTQLSMTTGLAIIERFYADGKRERVETPIEDIERLELQTSELEGGVRCSAILLRKTDGAALLFEDDQGDLRERAETLARFMEKQLTVLD